MRSKGLRHYFNSAALRKCCWWIWCGPNNQRRAEHLSVERWRSSGSYSWRQCERLDYKRNFSEMVGTFRQVFVSSSAISHAPNLAPEVIQITEENHIIILTFLTHTTNVLQHPDISVEKWKMYTWDGTQENRLSVTISIHRTPAIKID